MSKFVINGSVIGAVFAIVITLLGFLSKEMFEESRSTTRDFRAHETRAEKSTARLESHDALLDQRMAQLEIKLIEVSTDVKEILKRVK